MDCSCTSDGCGVTLATILGSTPQQYSTASDFVFGSKRSREDDEMPKKLKKQKLDRGDDEESAKKSMKRRKSEEKSEKKPKKIKVEVTE